MASTTKSMMRSETSRSCILLSNGNYLLIGQPNAQPVLMHKPGSRQRFRKPRTLFVLVSLLAVIILLHLIALRHTADPSIVPTNCMERIRTTDYTHVIHLQTGVQQLGAIQFVNQLDGGLPAALIQVENTSTQQLDVYVYGCTLLKQHPELVPLFTQHGLAQGTVSISSENTIITSQLDLTLSPEAATMLQPLQQYIYREYAWQHGTFVQVSFPGFYPVTSRSEAEALQQQANSGQQLPWSDPLVTAEQMAKDILKWPSNNTQDAVLSNDGTTAIVKLIQQIPALTVTVTLERLISQKASGLWFVVAAQTSGIMLNQPAVLTPGASTLQTQNQQNCSSAHAQSTCSLPATSVKTPLKIAGNGALADGQNSVTLFEHTLTPISSANNIPLTTNADGSFTGNLSYSYITAGQQGLLVIQSLPPSGSAETGQVLLVPVNLE